MQPSSLWKAASRRALAQSLGFAILLFAILASFLWWSMPLGSPVEAIPIVSLLAFLIGFGLLQWLFLNNTLRNLLVDRPSPTAVASGSPSATRAGEDSPVNHADEQKRLFVHLFAVLQREGRLMDFLQEDLSRFDDAQIGAAARGVHENCNKALARYLSPQPVMQQAEGETVVVPPDFDPEAVKLTGNVVGDPPFSGILRHRGWRLRSVAIPQLSVKDDPALIAPAEIEIA